MTSRDEEELWRSIVENYGERPSLEPDEPVPPSPPPAIDPDPYAVAGAPDGALAEPEPPPEEPDDPEDGFVPPPPPPLPRPSFPRWLAWAGVLGTPILMVLLAMAQITVRPVVGAGMAVAFVLGFGYLVATMDRFPRQPWDDGSAV